MRGCAYVCLAVQLLITPSKTAPAAVEAAPEAVSLPGTPVNEAQHKASLAPAVLHKFAICSHLTV